MVDNNSKDEGLDRSVESYAEDLDTASETNPFDDADFKDFDEKAPTKNSLGELWANNPFLKIGVILGGVILLVGAFVMFGGKEKPPVSEVNKGVEQTEAPGGNVNEAYRNAIEEVNQQRLETAEQTGQSAIPIPVAGPTIPETYPPNPPNADDGDPLAQWRAAAQAPTPDPEPPAAPAPEVAPTPQQPQQPQQPVENPYTTLMQQQMGNILNAQAIQPPKIMQVTDAGAFFEARNTAVAEAAATTTDPTKPQEILIAAGTMNYATMLLEANSDIPGPVMAKLQSGPLAGSKILGSFTNTDEYLSITFNTLVENGVSKPINAIALNPNTTLSGVATDRDSRYMKRVILPAAAEFLTGFAEAVTDYGKTDVTVNGETVTTETKDLNTKEQLYKGLGEGIKVIGEDAQQKGQSIKPMVKVAVGTPVGILFLEPLIKDDDTSAATR